MKEEDRINESIHTIQELQCTNCKIIGTEHNIDDWCAATSFYKKNWRATKNNNIYCPDCASKKLKPRKQ